MRALIAAAGEPPSTALVRRAASMSDIIIAADGGYRLLQEARVEPDLLIGDFDSLESGLADDARLSGIETESLSAEKDITDTEYAVQRARELGADNILLLGATGGRMDHFLGNLAVLAACARDGVRAQIEDDTQTIRVIDGDCVVEGAPGDTISLHPVAGTATVHASGLHYPLDGLQLESTAARGVSNIFTERQAHISTTSPLYLIQLK